MAQITDYASLISEVKNWLNDSNTADDTVKGFIQLAESNFRRRLATLDNEVTVTSVPASEFDNLPTGFNGLRSAFVSGSPNDPLVLIPVAQMDAQGIISGNPGYISIVSGQFRFNPSAEGSTVSYTYYRELTPLSDVDTENYLISEQPDVYLSGTLAVSQKFLRDDVDAAQHEAIVEKFFDELDSQDRRKRWASQRKQMGVQPVVGRMG